MIPYVFFICALNALVPPPAVIIPLGCYWKLSIGPASTPLPGKLSLVPPYPDVILCSAKIPSPPIWIISWASALWFATYTTPENLSELKLSVYTVSCIGLLGFTPFDELGKLPGKTPGYPVKIPPPLASLPGWNFFYLTPTMAPRVLCVNILSPNPPGYLFPRLGYPWDLASSRGLADIEFP